MKLSIDQLICGENERKAWDVLKTTMNDISLAKSLALKCDLPDPTNGINWIPAIRGFSIGDYYLIMRTFEDSDVQNVRRGRKISHVLVVKCDELCKCADLSSVIEKLPSNIEKDVSLQRLEVDTKSTVEKNNVNFQGRFNKVIHGYVNYKKYNNAIIWIDQNDFEEVVVKLWRRLSFQERVNFHFGISFNSGNIPEEKLNLLAVPDVIKSKYWRSNFLIVEKNENYSPFELSEQLLVGDVNASKRIAFFQETIEASTFEREDIDNIARVIDTFEKLDNINDLKKINTLSHVIAYYSPSPQKGKTFKEKVLIKIIELFKSSELSDIKLFHSFKIDSYQSSKSELIQAVNFWVANNILTIRRETDYTSFFNQLDFTSKHWLDSVFANSISSFINSISAKDIKIIIYWLEVDGNVVSIINPLLSQSKTIEQLFVKEISESLSKSTIQKLKVYSISNKWHILLATILLKEYPFEQALKEHLKYDTDEKSFDGINHIVRSQLSKTVVSVAAIKNDQRLWKIACTLCTKQPSLLNDIDFSNGWQEIWLYSISEGNKIDTGFTNPKEKFAQLFDVLIIGGNLKEELLTLSANSEYADITHYPDRSSLWIKLSSINKEKFLNRTSQGYLTQLTTKSIVDISNDPTLLNYVRQYGIHDFLKNKTTTIAGAISVFEEFTHLNDYILKDYIQYYTVHITVVDAQLLGKLIYTRRFSESAKLIYSRASKHNNWKYALNECYSLLGIFTQAKIEWSGIIDNVSISESQWWEAAEDIIIELYANGTSLTTLWKKAGGKESDLIMNTTSSNVWHDAISKLRQRAFKTISMNELLHEINKQYGNTEKFEIIYNLRKRFC